VKQIRNFVLHVTGPDGVCRPLIGLISRTLLLKYAVISPAEYGSRCRNAPNTDVVWISLRDDERDARAVTPQVQGRFAAEFLRR